MITSRGRKRWVFPKGCLEPGKTATEMALQEAWEEAGLVGTLRPSPVGTYFYEKANNRYHVTVFLMRVTQIASEWPEMQWRLRRWLRPRSALPRLQALSLRKLFSKLLAAELVVVPA
jgi:8-oxo-dGTP pyrophosphatase MutT (NUDIX family)